MSLTGSAIRTEPFDDLDSLSCEGLKRWWMGRLRTVFRIAARELRFYSGRFAREGFDPAGFRTLDDLHRVPVFNKDDLLSAQRESGSHAVGIERRTTARSGLILSLSSGTTGTTFVSHTARWRRMQGESSSRAHWWAGLRPGAPLLLSAPAWHSYAAIQPYIAERFGMPCVVVAGTYLPRFAARIIDGIRNFRPRFVTMFLPMVFSIISEAERQGLDAEDLFAGVESLVVTGAPITPGIRDHLRDLTKVGRVAEIAGSSENLLAVDCAMARGLHVVPDTCHADVIDRRTGMPAADGQRGSVVHTSVIPHGSMYLQFDGGDVGVIDRSPCPCGLPSPRIKLLGRWDDAFTVGGRMMLPYDVQFALEQEVPELCGTPFVITREPLGDGRLRLVMLEPEGSSRSLLDGARTRLARRFEMRVEIIPARTLPLRFKGVPPVLSETEARSAR